MKKLKRLKRKNGITRKTASMGAYQYQKNTLKMKAKAKGMTVSYYLNWVLWKEWL